MSVKENANASRRSEIWSIFIKQLCIKRHGSLIGTLHIRNHWRRFFTTVLYLNENVLFTKNKVDPGLF